MRDNVSGEKDAINIRLVPFFVLSAPWLQLDDESHQDLCDKSGFSTRQTPRRKNPQPTRTCFSLRCALLFDQCLRQRNRYLSPMEARSGRRAKSQGKGQRRLSASRREALRKQERPSTKKLWIFALRRLTTHLLSVHQCEEVIWELVDSVSFAHLVPTFFASLCNADTHNDPLCRKTAFVIFYVVPLHLLIVTRHQIMSTFLTT